MKHQKTTAEYLGIKPTRHDDSPGPMTAKPTKARPARDLQFYNAADADRERKAARKRANKRTTPARPRAKHRRREESDETPDLVSGLRAQPREARVKIDRVEIIEPYAMQANAGDDHLLATSGDFADLNDDEEVIS